MGTFLSPPAIISILIALSVHEWAHGFVARMFGDPTAEYEGRLTLNPLAHIDPLGALMFVLVGFGWGKPVPINPHYFRHPKRDTAVVSLAGPLSNFLLAWIAFALLLLFVHGTVGSSAMGILQPGTSAGILAVVEMILRTSIFINLGFMAFNLLPIAPLDGSKVLHLFIPLKYDDRYETFMRRGPVILLILLVVDQFLNIPILFGWIGGIMSVVLSAMNTVAGLL
ncbi:MAG: site-2 protease family protein [Candidatus Peregrinibacteria bacterium]